MRDLGELTAADWDPLVGTDFHVGAVPQTEDGAAAATGEVAGSAKPSALRLVQVTRLGDSPGPRQPFSLRFLGPASPVMPHAIHRLSHPGLGEVDLFVGPVLSGAPGTTYEAIFA